MTLARSGLAAWPPPVYDQVRVISLPITDPDATESVVLARHGTGPTDPMITQAEHALVTLLFKD